MARGTKSTHKEASSQRTFRTKTVPDMFLRQKAVASKKRNQRMDNSSDEEEDELNSSDSDSEADSDKETTKRNKKSTKNKRKTVSSKAVINVSSQLFEQVDESTLATQNSLFDKAILPENRMDKVAEKWVKQYKRNQKSALRDLINYVIRCSGCLMAVTADAMNQEDGAVSAIEELQIELRKLPHTDYPVVSKSKEYRDLRRNMLLLFQEIIAQCQHDAIYDGVLIETLQNWLATMSSSVYRPFRHTATLVALRVISALCDTGEKSRVELTTANIQLSAEEKKGENATNRTRSRTLKQKLTTSQQKCKDIEEFLTEFFNSIFIHRSRDVESVIRLECIKELCSWMQGYQAYFMDNEYLKFIGWAFNDQSSSVRLEALKSLIRLYKIEDIASKLSVFTRRFKSRIEEMALYDVDVSVRVNAIQLCSALYKLKIDVLSSDGRTELSNMIASDIPRVRKTAAPFVKALIDTNIIDPLLKEVASSLSATLAKSKGGRRSAAAAPVPVNQTWVNFKGLASFLVERSAGMLENGNNDEMQIDLKSTSNSLVEKRNLMITNIVEALWDQMKELQDYASFSDYLARDHSQTQQQQQNDDQMDTENTTIGDCYRLTEDEETVLINVFVVSLRTAITKGLDKNMIEGKDKKKMDDALLKENKNELSRHLVQALPKLLSKHSDDANRMAQLVSIPAIMNLNVYSELRAEKEYEELLETLSRVYVGATLIDLLTNCADSLHHMSKNTSLTEINNLHLTELKEAVTNQIREACSGKDLVTARYTSALIHSISVSMLRLACLINFTDATTAMEDSQGMSMNVIEYAGALIDRATFGHENEKDISLSALTVVSRYMMWKYNSLITSSTSAVTPVIERRRDWVVDKLVELITGSDVSPLAEVRVLAFGYLVDIYWIFTSDLLDELNLFRLKTNCPSDLQALCKEYVSRQIKAYNTSMKDADQDDEISVKKLAAEKELLLQLIASYLRGILVRVFEISDISFLLEQYGSNGPEIDEAIKALVAEFQDDLITGEVAADGICRAYMEALKISFNANVGDSGRSIDKTMKLARLEAGSLKCANELDDARQIPPQVVCERIHLDGISFALSKAAEAYQTNRDDEKGNALKFFKILNAFGKELTRARDIAKIHNHLEDCLRQNGLQVEENKKEWEYYVSYIKSIDEILKKKGLRYDATKRANHAETPAAHVFNDVELEDPMADIDELVVRDNAKRTLMEADMDIDDDLSAKRRRD